MDQQTVTHDTTTDCSAVATRVPTHPRICMQCGAQLWPTRRPASAVEVRLRPGGQGAPTRRLYATGWQLQHSFLLNTLTKQSLITSATAIRHQFQARLPLPPSRTWHAASARLRAWLRRASAACQSRRAWLVELTQSLLQPQLHCWGRLVVASPLRHCCRCCCWTFLIHQRPRLLMTPPHHCCCCHCQQERLLQLMRQTLLLPAGQSRPVLHQCRKPQRLRQADRWQAPSRARTPLRGGRRWSWKPSRGRRCGAGTSCPAPRPRPAGHEKQPQRISRSHTSRRNASIEPVQ